MTSLQGLVGVHQYAETEAEPHVAAVLQQLADKFACEPLWTGFSKGSLPMPTLQAAPLPSDIYEDGGYGDRRGAYRTVDVLAKVTLGEITWQISSLMGVVQGERQGLVSLSSHVNVSLDVTLGVPQDLELPNGYMAAGFLCQAEQSRLPNGDAVFRLDTRAGRLWLCPSGGQTDFLGHHLRRRDEFPFSWVGPRVVHLAKTGMFYRHGLAESLERGPWEGYTTTDKSDRPWVIQESTLTFATSCQLRVAGRHDDRLLQRSATVLQPPYQAVWELPQHRSTDVPVYVPFELRRSN